MAMPRNPTTDEVQEGYARQGIFARPAPVGPPPAPPLPTGPGNIFSPGRQLGATSKAPAGATRAFGRPESSGGGMSGASTNVSLAGPIVKGGASVVSTVRRGAKEGSAKVVGTSLTATLAAVDWINRASRSLDVVPGKGSFRPLQALDQQGAKESRELRMLAHRANLDGNKKLATFYSARAEVLDVLRPKGALDVALLVAPAAIKGARAIPAKGVVLETESVGTAGEVAGVAKALAATNRNPLTTKTGKLINAYSDNVAVSAAHGLSGARGMTEAEKLIAAAPRGSRINVVATSTRGLERAEIDAARAIADATTRAGRVRGTLEIAFSTTPTSKSAAAAALKRLTSVTRRKSTLADLGLQTEAAAAQAFNAKVPQLKQAIRRSGYKDVVIQAKSPADPVATKWLTLAQAGGNVGDLKTFRASKMARQDIRKLWKRTGATGSVKSPITYTSEVAGIKKVVTEPSALKQVTAAEKADAAFDKGTAKLVKSLKRGPKGKLMNIRLLKEQRGGLDKAGSRITRRVILEPGGSGQIGRPGTGGGLEKLGGKPKPSGGGGGVGVLEREATTVEEAVAYGRAPEFSSRQFIEGGARAPKVIRGPGITARPGGTPAGAPDQMPSPGRTPAPGEGQGPAPSPGAGETPAPSPGPGPSPTGGGQPQPQPGPAPIPQPTTVTIPKPTKPGARTTILAPDHEVTLPKGKPGAEWPDQIAFRQGVNEVRVRRQGRLEYGRDLSDAVPNDPTVKPWDSTVAEKYGPEKINRRLNTGVTDLHIEGRKVRYTEAPPVIRTDRVRKRRRPFYL